MMEENAKKEERENDDQEKDHLFYNIRRFMAYSLWHIV
jgi:hypothetical protein